MPEYTWEGGGEVSRLETERQAKEPREQWIVHWSLEPLRIDSIVAQDAAFPRIITAPDTNNFRVSLPNKETAVLLAAEIRRYIGHLAIDRLWATDKNAILGDLLFGQDMPSAHLLHTRLLEASPRDGTRWEATHTHVVERLRALADLMEAYGPHGWIGKE